MILLRLYWEFFKTGLFALGGGLATLPFLYAMAGTTGWFTGADVADMLAISEATPGPVGVNMATYVGYTTAGIPGSIIATLGLISPSIIIILLIARVLAAFRTNRYVEGSFYTLRPASTGLISAAGWSVLVLVMADTAAYAQTGSLLAAFRWKNAVLFALLWVLSNKVEKVKKLHPAVLLAFGAACGIVFRLGGV